MLYRYKRFDHPIDRLQQYICHFMRTARQAADAGKNFRVVDLCHGDFVPFVTRAPKLKKHLGTFYRAFKTLTPAERLSVYRAFRSCLNTRRLFRDHCPCHRAGSLPAGIQQPAHDLLGRDCNTVFKKAQDMLHDAAGNRRRAFYPFDGEVQVTVSLQGSVLPTATNRAGGWQIRLLPDIEEVRTWNDVFQISSRYEKDILQADYDSWLGAFRGFAAELRDIERPWTHDKIRVAMQRFLRTCASDDYREWRFIKHAVCQVWLNEADTRFYSALANSLS